MSGEMSHQQLTIGSLIDHAARYHGSTEVVSVETDGTVSRASWGGIGRNARRLASALGRLGIGMGERCATIAWNNRRHLEIYFGVAGGGMVCHTINPRLHPDQLIYVINHAADRVLFLDRTFVPLIAGLMPHLTQVKHVVLMGPRDDEAAAAIDGLMFYDELLDTGEADFQWPDFDETAPSSLCYTSGTTGHPKGVEYTHRSTLLHSIAGLMPHLTQVKHVVLMGPRDDEAAAAIDWLMFYDELLDTGEADFQWPDFDETAPSSLCYTSGTTGHPKGVEYTHRSTLLHSIAGNQPDGLAVSAKDTVMPVVPMFHVNAWGVPYIAAANGCKLVLPGPGLDGPSLVRLIDGEKVTLALGVPTIWLGLLAALEAAGSKAESLQRTLIGGAALPPSMIAAFRDKYGVEAIHGWGMTETSPLGTINQLLQKHVDLPEDAQAEVRLSQGRPMWGVELRVVDENGKVLPEDGVSQGNLQIRGHWVIDRYFGAERSAVSKDGWFDTGDVATLDPDGYLTIRDRSKDIIKSGGEWISTVELENIAIAHPGIANAAAIAATHPKWDERPVVIAVRANGAEPSEADILAFYDGKVAHWQIPDRIIFVDELPLGATGKVLKTRLREEFGQILVTPPD